MKVEMKDIVSSGIEFKKYNDFSFHWHDSVEIFYLIKGRVEFIDWGKKRIFEKGDFIVINANRSHLIKAIDGVAEGMEIHIPGNLCREHFDTFHEKVILCHSKIESTDSENKRNLLEVKKMLMDIKSNYSGESTERIEEKKLKILTLLIEKFDYVTCGINLKELDKRRKDRCIHIYRKYFQEVKSNTTLKEIAKESNINYHHLSKDIRNTYGKNYKKLRFFYLIEKAVQKLVSSRDNITEISYGCGFSDPKYFIKYFKEKYGCTPNEFRNRYHKNR